jgi:hypothetical protein
MPTRLRRVSKFYDSDRVSLPRRCKEMRFLPTVNTRFAVAPIFDQCRFTDVSPHFGTYSFSIILFLATRAEITSATPSPAI